MKKLREVFMKSMRIMLIFSTVLMLGATSFNSLCSFSDYIPFLGKKETQENIMKDYNIHPECMINIKGLAGNVTIKTWEQNKVSLQATKRAAKPEQLPNLGISDFITPHSLTINSTEKEVQPHTAIDYNLTVPSASSINVAVASGNITINGPIKGKISATTDNGNVEIEQANNTIIANATKTGSIKIKQAKAHIKTTTNKGNISITQSHNSIIATSEYGSIDVKAANVPATAKIKLTANVGVINVQLPKDINADLQACTKKGSIISQHAITLKPRTTTLDAKAWRQFKEQVDGILGSGEATIVLSTNKGNIKILDGKIA